MFGGKRRGWLRPWILSMLETGPKNGADIIAEVEKVSMGWWRPSPGSVYPLLESMVQEGLVTRRQDGKYEITAKGKDEVAWLHGPWGIPRLHRHQPTSMDAMLSDMESYISYFEDVAKSEKQKLSDCLDRIKALKDRLTYLTETVLT